jgi:hypothetical protein
MNSLMTWAAGFDLFRHILETFFYLVAGPLAAALTIRWVRRSSRERRDLLLLPEQLARAAREQPLYFQSAVVPVVKTLERALEARPERDLADGKACFDLPESKPGNRSGAVDQGTANASMFGRDRDGR